jgi:hypothetical protein
MHTYPRAAVERTMKVQEVILRAMAKKITWWQAAEIIGMSDRQMRRLHWRHREHGYDGLRGNLQSRVSTALGNPAQDAGFPLSHSRDGEGSSTLNRTYRVLRKPDILTC